MATEFLFDAIKKYIYPIMNFCGFELEHNLRPDGRTGMFYNNWYDFKFKNPKYNGQPDVSEFLVPCVPFSDEHYLQIKNTLGDEIFNPFENRNHMLAILIGLRGPMVPYCVSEDKLKLCTDEEDYDTLENFISLYNSTAENGDIIIGFTNTEHPENVKDLYEYRADNLFKAAWGLAVTVYKDISHDKSKEFEDIDKSWKKIVALCNKWDKARKLIKKEIKEEKLESFNMNYIELSDNKVDNDIEYRNFNFANDYIMNDDDVVQCNYLNSLFYSDSFKELTDNYNEPAIEAKTDYAFVPSNTMMPDMQLTPVVETENVMTIDGPNVSVEQEPIVPAIIEPEIKMASMPIKEGSKSVIKINKKPSNQMGMMNPMMGGMNMGMGMGMNPMMMGMGMYNMYGNQNMMNNSYDMQQLDLTGGDIVNPFKAYM